MACTKRSTSRAVRVAQQIEESKTKTDSLRSAMRFLAQMTPSTRDNYINEVQLQLNSWVKTADRSAAQYSPGKAIDTLPKELVAAVGAGNPLSLRFDYWDVDYLFQCNMMSKLSQWIVDFPVRDTLLEAYIEGHRSELSEDEFLRLQEAYKLFDWTIRNVMLNAREASVEETSVNPTSTENFDSIGTGYLPWEVALFSAGDFVERGRVFSALAAQRNINTFWIEANGVSDAGKLWIVGAAIGEHVFLFETKLGLPILEPDAVRLATLKSARENPRVLRRLDLPGQFDYAIDTPDLKEISLYVDATPCSDSARMKLLESSLLHDERMVVYQDIDARIAEARGLAPDANVQLWKLPLFAQMRAGQIRAMAQQMSDDALRYMSAHGIWLMDNPVANGRLKHLLGVFENDSDGNQGALDLYMNSRTDDQTISRLIYDPEVQKQLGVVRMVGEPEERFEMRLRQAQLVFTRAKVDAAFLLAQLHFDRGNAPQAESFLRRVTGDERAEMWYPSAYYSIGRIRQEDGDIEGATEYFTKQPSLQEAGNRLRLRYLSRANSDPE